MQKTTEVSRDVEASSCGTASTETLKGVDETEVWWDGDHDPKNPMNWKTTRKATIVGLVSLIGFSTPFSADVSAPAIKEIMTYFNSDSEPLAGFIISIYILGNAVGPLLFAPASEVWGRSLILNISNIAFVLCTIGCALSVSLPMLLIFRFLAGCAGSAPLAVGGGTIADLIPQQQRGRYLAVFAIGPQLAPIIGPVVGGFLAGGPGWRWTFWIVVIIHGTITVLTPIMLRETHAPTLLRAKARQICLDVKSEHVRIKGIVKLPKAVVFKRASVRPMKMLFRSPIVLFLATLQATVWGYRYIMFTTIPLVFGQQYHFTSRTSGLAYLGNGIGASVALYSITKLCDHLIATYKESSPGKEVPAERRLLPMIWAAPLCPIGLLWYGWSAQERTHWIVPILGTVLFGAGITASSLPATLYMIDAFTEFAASGLAASFFLRSVAGGFLPLAGTPLYTSLGVGWGASVLSFIALVLCAFPPLMYRYGESLRTKHPVRL